MPRLWTHGTDIECGVEKEIRVFTSDIIRG